LANVHGLAIGIVGAGLLGAALWHGSPQPRLMVPAEEMHRDRIIYPRPLSLPGTDKAIRSILNVPAPMRFGQFVWDDAGIPDGPIWMRIDRKAQLISVFRGADEIATAVILYGAPDKPTPQGRYPILEMLRDHRSRSYDADMPFTLRLTGDGVAIHASDVRAGYATHGCIGIPLELARRLFHDARTGDVVFIV
jgi:hypothetical protein